MLPVLEFDNTESFALYLGAIEISQQNNPNANARLFVIRDRQSVAKIFDGVREADLPSKGISFVPGAERNIENLIKISEILPIDQFPQIALPTTLISFGGQVVGYEMPYISGMDLGVALGSLQYSHRQKINWFNQLAEIILSLPNGVFIGDLHAQNVIVQDNGSVTLIDVDGFSLASGHLLTSPAMFMQDLPSKYYSSNGTIRIDRDTDILCLFRIFFRYLFEGHDVAYFPLEWKHRLMDYLEKRGVESNFISAVSHLFSQERNTIHKELFSCWTNMLPRSEYRQFLKLTGLDLIESESRRFINTMIGENPNKRTC